jgi:invasion protein IalB
MRVLDIRLAAAIALVACCGPVRAQQSTSATYSDWVVQCQNDSGAPDRKTCEMTQVTQVKGKNIAFSRIALDRPAAGRPIRLEVQLPVNISLRDPVTIRTDDADSGLSQPFDHCVPAGCFAEFELKDEAVKKLRGAEGAGKATFKDAGGRDVVVPISFKGFREALLALGKKED